MIKSYLKTSFLLIIFNIFLSTHIAFAHGVVWQPISDKTNMYGLKFGYEDGSIMTFANVKITAPDDKIYQSGLSDKHGVFAFIPDGSGTWKIKADDGQGHLVQAELTINLDNTENPVMTAPTNPNDSKAIKMLFALSLLMNLALIFMFMKQKKLSANS